MPVPLAMTRPLRVPAVEIHTNEAPVTLDSGAHQSHCFIAETPVHDFCVLPCHRHS